MSTQLMQYMPPAAAAGWNSTLLHAISATGYTPGCAGMLHISRCY